ncbi:MAG: putative DNA modification/repair radical SAM protein [Clostridia bacterium]|nr:putative DNA modification/repair radical SAM protein [Clostridia bacterium]
MTIMEKLTILSDAAKYDVACTSSGVGRAAKAGAVGNSMACGICHSFSADGRCISLLKVLQSNACVYDCSYCVNRRSNDTARATFTPRELAELTMAFYRRNYIEGLFLSSGVIGCADNTMELMIRTLSLLREEYRFGGYIHAKAIPGADERLVARLGRLADRMSVNLELPSRQSLQRLAPDKRGEDVLRPMDQIAQGIRQTQNELTLYRHTPRFVPAGQSTQMIVGASPETDRQILSLTAGLYKKYRLKRVFFSAYMPVVADSRLPALTTRPPLLREHRLYQADWLLRFYGFSADEILDEKQPNFHPLLDPKCNWAVNHPEFFPVEVNRADYEALLRVPGVGVTSARRILQARRGGPLSAEGLRRLGVVMKRAQYFITVGGRMGVNASLGRAQLIGALSSGGGMALPETARQLSFFDTTEEDLSKCLTGQI